MKDNNLNIDINNGENIAECEFKHIHQDIIRDSKRKYARRGYTCGFS